MESSLLGRNVTIAPRRRASRAPTASWSATTPRSGSCEASLVTGAGGMLGHDVVAAARGARPRGRRRRPRASSTSPTPTRDAARSSPTRAPDAVVNCAAWTDVDGAEADEDARARRQRRRRRATWRAPRPQAGARARPRLDRLRLRRRQATRPYVESDPTGPRTAYGRTKLAGEHAVAAAAPTHAIVRTAWLFGAGGQNFVDTMLRARRRARRGHRRRRPGRLPDLDRPPRARAGRRSPSAAATPAILHVAGAGQCSWYEFARRDLRPGRRRRAACCPTTSDGLPAPAPRPACSVLGTERADGVAAAALAGGPRRPPRRTEASHEAARLRRRRLHRLELRPRPRRATTATTSSCSTSSPTPAGGRTSPTSRRRASCTARSRTPRRSREAIEGVDAVVNFAAETHVDRSIAEPDAFVAHARASAPTCCSRRPAQAGVRYVQVSTDEVYGSIEEGSFTEESPLQPSSPYSATKAGADLLVASLLPHLRARDGDLPRLEQLRALPVPREADPADGPQRAARRQAARLRRRACRCATGSTSRTSRAGSATCSSTACPGEVYNVGGPDEVPEPRRRASASSR